MRAVRHLGILALVAACGETAPTTPTAIRLDRPVDVAFACWGGLDVGNGDDDFTSAQPLDACRIRSIDSNHATNPDDQDADFDANRDGVIDEADFPPEPAGQENVTKRVDYYAFTLNSEPGTVTLYRFDTKAAFNAGSGELFFQDGDELTPGINSVPVGTLPVGIETDRAGCHMITANAGSCDLSVLDVDSFLAEQEDASTDAEVNALTVTNAAGEPVVARPADLVAEPAEAEPIGVACPAEPEGLVYVAYPECHLVAAVRPATGRIEAGIRFNADGTVEITDGNVSCPAQCGGGGVTAPGERPITLDLVHDARVDTRRLVIGAENSPSLTIVDLDAGYLPVAGSLQRATLAGDIGVRDVAMSVQIGMGGNTGDANEEASNGGQHQFVYAVASDATVRVVDIIAAPRECDTQVDPRYLRGVSDVGRLACLPVGDPMTPPRRPLARGPGIEMVGGSVPLGVTIERIVPHRDFSAEVDPDLLVGHFAFVTVSTGRTLVVNIDDDMYADFWSATNPLGSMPALAIPHQLRDSVSARDRLAEAEVDGESVPICNDRGSDEVGGPHLAGSGVTQNWNAEEVVQEKSYVLPNMRRLLCDDGRENVADSAIFELDFSMDRSQRDLAFPDLRALRANETWYLTWEGTLSRDEDGEAIDGPILRSGIVDRISGGLTIRDPSRPFCAVGTELFDIAVLAGCDPAVGDADCGVGEVCYVHPEATVGRGACLPEEDVDVLSGVCRDYLVSMRRYSIVDATADVVEVVPRRHVLTTTPVDGCTSDQHCADLALFEARLASTAHPIEDTTPPPAATYRCEQDPTRAGLIDRCVQVCEDSTQCAEGTICSGGYCVEGVLPPQECVAGAQGYTIRAGDAFAVVGDVSGYLHPIIEDPTTGACVRDPAASPLLVGRIPLTAPECPGPDAFTSLAPNPCATTVEQTEKVPDYTDLDTCEIGDQEGRLITRDAPAIRFKNPMFTFHLVDPWYPGDASCREDRAGTAGMIPVVHPGLVLQLPIALGFNVMEIGGIAALPSNIVRGPPARAAPGYTPEEGDWSTPTVWVVDEGDDLPDPGTNVPATRGQLIRIETINVGVFSLGQ